MFDMYLTRKETYYYQHNKHINGFDMVHDEYIINIYDLLPADGRKSFYGKAKVVETENYVYLLSYDTIICRTNKTGGNDEFIKYWDCYSATTMRHINAFMNFIGLAGCGGKKWWEQIKPYRAYCTSELVNII